jgi:hypothetical protein
VRVSALGAVGRAVVGGVVSGRGAVSGRGGAGVASVLGLLGAGVAAGFAAGSGRGEGSEHPARRSAMPSVRVLCMGEAYRETESGVSRPSHPPRRSRLSATTC